MRLGIKKMHKGAKLPVYGSSGAACMDVSVVEDYYLKPGDVKIMNTGLAFELPEGYEMQIRPRGSAIKNQIIILNSPGTLDEDYTGNLFIGVKNISDSDFLINKGDRVAQISIHPVIKIELYDLIELKQTERGDGCLGSTGK